MSFRYSRLCGTASDAVDVVKLETLSLGICINTYNYRVRTISDFRNMNLLIIIKFLYPWQKKKNNRYTIFLGPKCPQNMFLIVLRRPCPAKSGVNGKRKVSFLYALRAFAVKIKLVLLEHQTITISSQSPRHILILPVYPFSIQSVYT
jgi:hypothetical protein